MSNQSVLAALHSCSPALTGRKMTQQEANNIIVAFSTFDMSMLIAAMMLNKLINCSFECTSADRAAHFSMTWMSPQDMIDEAFSYYPGIVASANGYVPVGTCNLGTGDPYFIRPADTPEYPLYRIQHDMTSEGDTHLPKKAVSRILRSLSELPEYLDTRGGA